MRVVSGVLCGQLIESCNSTTEARRLAVSGLLVISIREALMNRAWVARSGAVVAVLLLVVSSGCANKQQKVNYDIEMRKISLDTQPSGAKVYQLGTMDGSRTFLGTTPIKEQTVAVTTGASFKRISPAQMQDIAA